MTDFFGTPRAVVVALLVSPGTAGRRRGSSSCRVCAIGLTGREWLIKSSVLFRLSLLVLIGPIAHGSSATAATRGSVLWNAVPWILAVLVCFKMSAAAWIATRLHRGRLLGDRTLVTGAACGSSSCSRSTACSPGSSTRRSSAHFFLVLVGHPGHPPGAAVRGAAGARVESASRNAAARPTSAGGRRPVLGAALVLLGLPVVLAVILAVSFYVRNRNNGAFVSSGEKREYLLYVPKSYDRARPTPLVISLHGGGLWAAAQMEMSQWNAVADEQGFLVVYPSGVGGRGPRAWRAGAGAGSAKDVRFIAELIDTLKASYNIDPTRIYADGLSNGGGMAFVLSCTLSDRIAAVGMVASAHFLPWSGCTGPSSRCR